MRHEVRTEFEAATDGVAVYNPMHGVWGRFDQHGVRVVPPDGDWSVRLRLRAAGRGEAPEPLEAAWPRLEGCPPDAGCTERVLYERAWIREWYVNTLHGIEQRFDLTVPPPGDAPVRLSLSIETALTVEEHDDGRTIAFTRPGQVLLTLSNLRAWDADGKPLKVAIQRDDTGIHYVIDDRGARWPLVVDPPLGSCPAQWCSDGDASTIDVCADAGQTCTRVFDETFEGQPCVWGAHCCPDGKFHADCSDPTLQQGLDCPDGWCSDGDPATTDQCSGYRSATGTFDCSWTFDASVAGMPCTWGKHCCADGHLHEDCSAPGVAAGQDCPDGWCNDGDPTTADVCSNYVPATGERTCTHALDPAAEGKACTYGTWCCPGGVVASDCEAAAPGATDPAQPDTSGAPEPDPEDEAVVDSPAETDPPTGGGADAPPEPEPEPSIPADALTACEVSMGDDGPCPKGQLACDLAFEGGTGCVEPSNTCDGVTVGKAYEVGPGDMLVIEAEQGSQHVRLHYIAQPDSLNELRFLGANNKLLGQIDPMPCPSFGIQASIEPLRFAFFEPVERIVVGAAVSSVFLDAISFGAQGLTAGSCGDGVLNTGEACDDGNSSSEDGCSAPGAGGGGGCQVEEGFFCTTFGCKEIEPSAVAPAAKCTTGSCHADASCSVVDNAVVCTCLPGYVGDGKTCTFQCSESDLTACDDGDACTTDSCGLGGCITTPVSGCDPAVNVCRIEGSVGETFTCAFRVSRARFADPKAAQLSATLTWPSANSSIAGLRLGNCQTAPCAATTYPTTTTTSTGHVLSTAPGTDPAGWSGAMSLTLTHPTDPAAAVSTAYEEGGATLGDSVVVEIDVLLATNAPTTAPVFVSLSQLTGTTSAGVALEGTLDDGLIVFSTGCTADCPAGTGEACAASADCGVDLSCVGLVCLRDDTAACTDNGQCAGDCFEGACVGGSGTPFVQVLSGAVAEAFEKEQTSAQFLVRRSGDTSAPLVVQLSRSGTTTTADTEWSVGGVVLASDSVTIPAGASEVAVDVRPVQDNVDEVPETLIVGVAADAAYDEAPTTLTLTVSDATNIAANTRLFFAPLGQQTGATTVGSGYSILRLQGDNSRALVDLTFTNLTSIQTAVHIHYDATGDAVESLPLGQVEDYEWVLGPGPAALPTAQDVLTALVAGDLYVNVHSANFPEGELRGDYAQIAGAVSFVVPADPPAVTALDDVEEDRDLIRFLNQTTFGATPEALTALRDRVDNDHGGDRIAAMRAVIREATDNATSPSMLDYTVAADSAFDRGNTDRQGAFWTFARYSPVQLRQRMAYALSQIMVVSDDDNIVRARFTGTSTYWDMLADNSFGTYRDLLYDVTFHPIMGIFLSHLKNEKEQVDSDGNVVVSPDENYAREIMQLFTFGLLKLHPDGTVALDASGEPVPTYDNEVITQMAKVFTGLSFSKRLDGGVVVDNTNFNLGTGGTARWEYPMAMFSDRHDRTEKTVFDGLVIPANTTDDPAQDLLDLALVHDHLIDHASTAPRIARLLIQRFTSSNPSPGYVYRVGQVLADSSRDLGDVMEAILLDYEARELSLTANAASGKVREPVLRYSQLLRLFSAASSAPVSSLAAFGYAPPTTELEADATILNPHSADRLAQVPLSAPTVFNFYLPDYAPAGTVAAAGLVSPEMQIINEATLYDTYNMMYSLLINEAQSGPNLDAVAPFDTSSDIIRPDFSVLQQVHDDALAGGYEALAAGDEAAATAVVDWLDLYLTAGELKARYEGAAAPTPRSVVIEAGVGFGASERVKNLAYLVAVSPQAAVAR